MAIDRDDLKGLAVFLGIVLAFGFVAYNVGYEKGLRDRKSQPPPKHRTYDYDDDRSGSSRMNP